MDNRLSMRVSDIQKAIDDLEPIEKIFLELEANKKVLYSVLFLKSLGKNIAEREAFVYASDDWKNFIKGHVAAEVDYHKARRELELKFKAYDGEHISLKTETQGMKRVGA